MRDEAKRLANDMFAKSEYESKMGLAAATMIVSDMLTLFAEFKKASGPGALFYNYEKPEESLYMTSQDVYNDMIKAEEYLDTSLKDVLSKLLGVIAKHENTDDAIICTLDGRSLSVNILDPTHAKEQLEEIRNEARQKS